MTRNHRRTAIAGGATALIALLAAAVVVLWPSTGHAPVDKQEQADKVLAQFADTAAPSRGLSSSVVTPAGQDWWSMVTGLSGSLGLPATSTPDGAVWYAATTSEAYRPTESSFRLYHSVYVQFRTADAAEAYHPGVGEDACYCVRYVRGNLVTLTDVWVDPTREAFRDLPDGLDLTAPEHGAWDVDVDALASQLVSTTRYPDALRDYFTHVGFGASEIAWHATSETARGPWTGSLDGWDSGDVDIPGAAEVLATTLEVECDNGSVCETTSYGLVAIDLVTYLVDDTVAWGEREFAPESSKDLDSSVLAGGLDPDRWEGLVNESGMISHTQIDKVTFTISKQSEMTVLLTMSAP